MTHILLNNSETDSTVIETSGRTIRPALAPVAEVVDETRMHVSKWGLYTRAVDPANVGMVSHAIYPNAFDEYECHEAFTMGWNVDYATSALSQARLGKRTDDPVSLDLTSDRNIVDIERDGVTYSEKWDNIDPDSIRQEPDVDIGLPDQECQVGPSQLGDSLEHLYRITDHITLMVRDGNMVIQSEQDTGDSVVRFDETDMDSEATSPFSMDYVRDYAKAVKKAKVDNLTLAWGDEYPVFMQYERTDSEDNVMYEGQMMLAPRIQS